MPDFVYDIKIRTQQSYSVSLASSRSSNFISSQSLYLDDQDIIDKFKDINYHHHFNTIKNININHQLNNNSNNNFINNNNRIIYNNSSPQQNSHLLQQQQQQQQQQLQQQQLQIKLRLSLQLSSSYSRRKTDFKYDKKQKFIEQQQYYSVQKQKKQKLNGSININKQLNNNHKYTIPLSIQRLLKSYKRCNLIVNDQLLNVAYGAMFGFVIGDAIGSHLIHKNVHNKQIITNALQMKNGGIFNTYPGQGTDQTQIMLSLAYGLLQSQSQYNPNIIAFKYWQWIQSKPFDYPTLAAISFCQIRKQKNKQQFIGIRNSLQLSNIAVKNISQFSSISIFGYNMYEPDNSLSYNISNNINNNNNNNFQIQQNSNIGQKLIKGSTKNINHRSSLALIKMIPLVLWSINFNDQQFYLLLKQQMKLLTPNQFSTQVCYIYGIILRSLLKNRDHQYAIHQASKIVYTYGSQQLINLWKMSQRNQQIQINGHNMNNISIPMLYMLNLIHNNNKNINFVDSLISILLKGYNTDTNSAIVMAIIGAVVGVNQIPNYYKNKIIQCKIQKGNKKRNNMYCSSKIIQIVPKLIQNAPSIFKIK